MRATCHAVNVIRQKNGDIALALNSIDAELLDDITREASECADACAALADSAYPDLQSLAAQVARVAHRLADLSSALSFDARERETEPGDRE